MLKFVQTQQEYKSFLSTQKHMLGYSSIKSHSESKKIRSMLWKLAKLETDSISSILLSLYSQNFGRPAIDPLIFIRSFSLCLSLRFGPLMSGVKSSMSILFYSMLLALGIHLLLLPTMILSIESCMMIQIFIPTFLLKRIQNLFALKSNEMKNGKTMTMKILNHWLINISMAQIAIVTEFPIP